MPPIVVEAGAALDASGRVVYRWACSRCGKHGEWRRWLSDAERDGYAHRREHQEAVQA